MEEGKPLVVAIDMGYGHMRAASPLAAGLSTTVLHVDKPPLADADEQQRWANARWLYETISRSSQRPVIGGPLRVVLDAITSIPHLHPYRDLSAPHAGVRWLRYSASRGLGKGLAETLQRTQAPLLTTFYAPAILADYHGYKKVFCVVTDVDVNRVWAIDASRNTNIEYFAPSQRAVRRLQAFGVPPERVHFTGFPLPDELLGGSELTVLRENLRARLVRLDPSHAFRSTHRDEIQHFLGDLPDNTEPPQIMYAVGGAGAQADVARRFLPSMADALRNGTLRLCLVAGMRPEVAHQFEAWIDEAGLHEQLGKSIEILHEPTWAQYYARFNQVLARTDVLWSKPSEITFYAALGIPLVMSWPVGVHEVYNRRWVIENGAGLKQRDPRHAYAWLGEWLADGTLAAAAWQGFMRLPKFGTFRIVERLRQAV